MQGQSIRVPSFAKVNLTLDVLGLRADGYHELRTIYQTVGLADWVELRIGPGTGVQCVCDAGGVPSGPANLAYSAATHYLEAAGVEGELRVEIRLQKEIPPGGGLGGGSSNAAATLLGLAFLTGPRVGWPELFAICRRLGADVPLFLLGGTVLGVGRGDEVFPLEDAPPANLVVANPGVVVETGKAFARHRSRLTGPDRLGSMASFLAARRIRDVFTHVGNDLERTVEQDVPAVAATRAALVGAGSLRAWMTGSGASVVGIFESASGAVSAAEKLAEEGIWARAVETIDRAAYQAALGIDVLPDRFHLGV
jgi:4-diphosphocytidyl-2-C-methyl-D-erythritol kinase